VKLQEQIDDDETANAFAMPWRTLISNHRLAKRSPVAAAQTDPALVARLDFVEAIAACRGDAMRRPPFRLGKWSDPSAMQCIAPTWRAALAVDQEQLAQGIANGRFYCVG
jgi:hypothetical protein